MTIFIKAAIRRMPVIAVASAILFYASMIVYAVYKAIEVGLRGIPQ